jgi:predicted HTH transcriptional regulator
VETKIIDMTYVQAKRVEEIVNEFEQLEKQVINFNNTKEFCEIEFRGENGNEREFSFWVREKDEELRQEIRTLVINKLKERLAKLTSELSNL